MSRFWIQSLLPGFGLIVIAFITALMPQTFLALIGFLSFFIMGITLIVEGWKSR